MNGDYYIDNIFPPSSKKPRNCQVLGAFAISEVVGLIAQLDQLGEFGHGCVVHLVGQPFRPDLDVIHSCCAVIPPIG